jgi:hypothetical protein
MGLGGSPPKGWAVLKYKFKGVDVVRRTGNHWYVELQGIYRTGERGHKLLQLEKKLRRMGWTDAEVFLEPKGDINALRLRLRGVKTDAKTSTT